jgi:hypothetical protein
MQKWDYLEVLVADKFAFWWTAPGKDEHRAVAWYRPSGVMGFKRSFHSVALILKELGQEGWELVASNPVPDTKSDYAMFFKRPVEEGR